MCLSQLSEVQGSEKNLIAQLVSQLSLSEIMVQGRTNIGQLISQLLLSENVVHGEPWGLHGVEINTRCYCKSKRYQYSTMQRLAHLISHWNVVFNYVWYCRIGLCFMLVISIIMRCVWLERYYHEELKLYWKRTPSDAFSKVKINFSPPPPHNKVSRGWTLWLSHQSCYIIREENEVRSIAEVSLKYLKEVHFESRSLFWPEN